MNIFSDTAQGAVKGFGEAIGGVIARFKADPTKVLELEAELQKAAYGFQATVISSVNATMQAEARSEHWIQYSWRPTIGFTFAGTVINNYILLPYFKVAGLQPIEIPDALWGAILVILGAAAYTRGTEKIERLKGGIK